MDYPSRVPFFAYKYIRLLTQTCAANELGPYATLMCQSIAMQEDVIRYTRAITFYNQALMGILGIARWESLNAARAKAVSKGWLHYENKGKRKPGVYWVTIPEVHQALMDLKSDGHCDVGPKPITQEQLALSLSASYKDGYNAGYNDHSLSLVNRYNTSDNNQTGPPLSLLNSDRASDNTSDNASDKPSEPSTLLPIPDPNLNIYTQEKSPSQVPRETNPDEELFSDGHADKNQVSDPQILWSMERLQPWAMELIRAGAHIGKGNWTNWQRLCEDYSLAMVLEGVEAVKPAEPWPTAVEAHLKIPAFADTGQMQRTDDGRIIF